MRTRVRGHAVIGSLLLSMALLPAAAEAGPSTAAAQAGPPTADLIRTAIGLLDLNRPDLAAVKERVDVGDLEGSAEQWLRYARNRKQPQWYWTRTQRPVIAEMIRREMPETYRAALASAEEIMKHRFPNSCAAPLVKRVQLGPDFSFMDNPEHDRQFLYMLHRHRFWEELAIAYALTQDEHYAEEWAAQLERWLDELPLPASDPEVRKHDMWSGLDVGVRGFTWPWAYFCFLDSPALTPELHARWLTHFAEHAWFLRHHHAGTGSNWCVMQMSGLLSIALTFPELKGSEAWRDYAVQKLIEALRTQVRPDGVQVEQSPSYHVGCVLWFSEPMRLGGLSGIRWPDDYRQTLEKMCEFAMWIIGPDGELPALSDTDRDRMGREALAAGAILFDRPDFAARAELSARSAWLHGLDGIRKLAGLKPQPPTERVRHFPNGGYVVMRSGWDDRASFAVLDCGPRGGWHGHYDLLNIEIHGFGKLLIADPGRWWYDESELRRELLSTSAHNTISLDGESHAGCETNDNREYEMPKVETRDGWTYIHGRHRAYDKMPGPPVCQRRVFYDGSSMWIIVDRVDSPDPHDVLVNYQFAVAPVSRISPTAVLAGPAGEPQALILHEARPELSATLEPSTISRVYGQKEPATRLRLCQSGRQVQIVAAIHAFTAAELPPARLTISDADPTEIHLHLGSRDATIRFSQADDWSATWSTNSPAR